MADQASAPSTLQEALDRGFKSVPNPERYLADKSRSEMAYAGLADCQTSPAGSKCFEKTYPDGTVVGFCDGNGICKLYKK